MGAWKDLKLELRQQRAVQDAAFARYIENLRQDARKAVTEAKKWEETVRLGESVRIVDVLGRE